MPPDSPYDVEGDAYGELLGEYFEVATEISRLLDDFGRPRRQAEAEYEALRERKRELRERLAQAEEDPSSGDIQEVLDRALSSE